MILWFVKNLSGSEVDQFIEPLENWGSEWVDIEFNHLNVINLLTGPFSYRESSNLALLQTFRDHRNTLHWEQSYTTKDKVVGDDMLSGYGFAEIVGKRGPFISHRIRAGIGIWGSNIKYPIHQHEAEEVYIVLEGSADFILGDNQPVKKGAGDLVFVKSNLPHGFNTTEDNLFVLYLWKGGDLRQKSSFTISVNKS